MKVSDLIFKTPLVAFGMEKPAICRVRVFVSPDHGVVALLTDLGDHNPGRSLTNSIEHVYEALIARGIIDRTARIIEHYERIFGEVMFHFVSFSSDGTPNWERLSPLEAATLLGCTEAELEEQSLQNERIHSEIMRITNEIDPFFDSPEHEDASVINRRVEIQQNMVSKQVLSSAVSAGATERELQAILRSDLSLLAEVYAQPRDDYICFAEFPIADGIVDFAVFTSTSRMEVILIEIKGANFYLVNKGSYGNFSAKVNEAAQQIRRRVGSIFQHLAEFRTEVHRIREAVESGKKMYNSFIGPYGSLGVDPEKDIYIRSVIIAGRSRNDLEESHLRHDFESSLSPPVRLESWDTWLKKLRRQ